RGVVSRGPSRHPPLQLLGAARRREAFFDEAPALRHLGAQRAFTFAGAPAFFAQRVARRLGLRHHVGGLRQLLEPLPEILAVVHDRLELAVEDAEYGRVLGPKGPAAGGTLPLRTEALDLVALLFDFVVLLQQLGAPRAGVLLLAHPRRLLLLGRAVGD